MSRKSRAKPPSPFRRFSSSPEVIWLLVLLYVRFSLSLRNVENLLFERRTDLCHETVKFRSNRCGPMFAADVRCQRISRVLSVGWQLVSAWRNSGETLLNLCRKDFPLCQCGRAAGFVGFSVGEVAFGIEMVVNRSVHGSEFLQRLHLPKSQHRSLSSSERQVRILRSIVQPTAHLTAFQIAQFAHCRRI